MYEMAGAAPVDCSSFSLPLCLENFTDGNVLEPHVWYNHSWRLALYARNKGGPGEDPLVHMLQNCVPKLPSMEAQRLRDPLHV